MLKKVPKVCGWRAHEKYAAEIPLAYTHCKPTRVVLHLQLDLLHENVALLRRHLRHRSPLEV